MSPFVAPVPEPDSGLERQAIIDLSAIANNIRHLRELSAPAQFMAVVKADAYGHGAVQVAQTAVAAGAQWLGTAHIAEALALREAGIDAPVLSWLHTPLSDFTAAVANNIDLGCSGWELEHIVGAVRALERPARVHLKIDTGLGRNGCSREHWSALVDAAMGYQREGLIRVVGVFSHLAVADAPERPETDEQLERFREAVAVAEAAGADLEVRHLANTPATLSRPDTHFDLVRVGLGIYGLSPFPDRTSAQLGLVPAMTLATHLALCKNVPAGQGVSYGLNYVTAAPTTLGLVPMGYADGIPRVATGGPVRVNGITYPVVGRIAMDQMVIDLGPHAEVAGAVSDSGSEAGPDVAAGPALGATAVLFGNGHDGGPLVEQWADAAGTINYEVVTRISQRVPRSYTGGVECTGGDQ
ncbi:alanine racemase [Arthrobacter sp. PAMC 25486]|uniref:alanine racemase n=1 Tax=Arthrobacter sp. PAMC 25486 TaxID=1494608 RepID=UPI000535A8EF|nr:alanine racemase [Arthrobacter sp. PAMC 25486]AIY01666.1 alanine racemase [Arthrobacter sp. PAMC 25486]